jgi:hypothetical protein
VRMPGRQRQTSMAATVAVWLVRSLSAVERGAALPGDRVNAAGVKDVVSRSLYFGAWADKEVNASSLN